MTEYQLAESFHRIAEDLIAGGYPSNSTAHAIRKEAERLNPPPPRKPREWWIHIPLISCGKVHIYPFESTGHGADGGAVWDGECVRVREVIE